ncbi:MAG: glycerol acyltransferase [Bacteroidetes bacterium]|nr:glycerol acyltransferase [Bacteroidota bacterium]
MEKDKLIDIRYLIKSKNPKLLKWLPGFVVRYFERILHQNEINKFISDHKDDYDIDFCKSVMAYFNINIEIDGAEKIPSNERIVVVMNHPLGGMDAMAFITGFAHIRQDYKFIVNDLLLHVKNLRGLFLGVNKFGKNDGSTRNKIDNLFESNDSVCIFPAGKVSRRIKGQIKDLEWKKTFVTLSRKYKRKIVPIYIDGELSNFFYRLYELRQRIGVKTNLEMMYLADEMFKQKNKTIRFTVRDNIDLESFYSDESDREVSVRIRNILYDFKS